MRRDGFVYVLEAENGLVKIGYSVTPEKRERISQTHSPVRVRMIAFWKADQDEEFDLHRRFEDYREHGEWFRYVGEIAAWVDRVRGTNVLQITQWSDLTIAAAHLRKEEQSKRQAEAMRRLWRNLPEKERANWIASMQEGRADLSVRREALRPDVYGMEPLREPEAAE